MPGPLHGVKVIELGQALAGPLAGVIMADLGADVIKVENPDGGDAARQWGPPFVDGDSVSFHSNNRAKRSITLDIKAAADVDALKRLVRDADILIQNLRPGIVDDFCIGPDAMLAVNPRLIMVRISGYGQTGPYKDRPGFGRIGNAFGGLSFLAGYPDRAPVTPGSATIPDYMAGLYGALGTLLALQARLKTGRGQVVDIGLYEPIFRILDELAPAFQHS